MKLLLYIKTKSDNHMILEIANDFIVLFKIGLSRSINKLSLKSYIECYISRRIVLCNQFKYTPSWIGLVTLTRNELISSGCLLSLL